jgi:hypothetical protein
MVCTRLPLGSLGAKVALARRLGLIDAPVERALSALRKLRNAFAHSAESASLADPAHSAPTISKVVRLALPARSAGFS